MRASRKENVLRRMQRFFREVWSELSKVLWPSRKEVVNNTVIVMGLLVVVGSVVWVLDAVFRSVARALGLFT